MYSVRLVPRHFVSHAEVRGTVIARSLLIAEEEEEWGFTGPFKTLLVPTHSIHSFPIFHIAAVCK